MSSHAGKKVRGYGLAAGFVGEPARAEKVDVMCPRCGAVMVKLANRKTGELFWSCAFFPKCRGTRRL